MIMPMYIDNKVTQNDEHETVEPIMVTIVLAEYRSLIEENARLNYENQRLCNSLYEMERELKEREGK